MKTKEIDCYVFQKDIDKWEQIDDRKFMDIYKDLIHGLKAKLVIELPERKKEFTESEIKRILRKAYSDKYYENGFIEGIVDELFKD